MGALNIGALTTIFEEYLHTHIYEIIKEGQRSIIVCKSKSSDEIKNHLREMIEAAKKAGADEIRIDKLAPILKNSHKGCPLTIKGISIYPIDTSTNDPNNWSDNYQISVWVTGKYSDRIQKKWRNIFIKYLPHKNEHVYLLWSIKEGAPLNE